MNNSNSDKFGSAIFLTFSGNCKEALTFYQTCFGGKLHLETLTPELPNYAETPVVSGSLVAESMVIHGSDLVHNEGRILGNYMAICIHCANAEARKALLQKLAPHQIYFSIYKEKQKLIEITDTFDVRWVLSA